MTEQNSKLTEHTAKLMNPKRLLRLLAITLILHFAALAIGIAFLPIFLALFWGVMWFMLYWEPAYRIYTKVLKITDTEFMRAPLPWWQAIILGIKALFILYLLCAGIYLLIKLGPLNQNLIYILVSGSSH